MRQGPLAAGLVTMLSVGLLAASAGAQPTRSQSADGGAAVGFELRASRVTPKRALFDGKRAIKLRYRFAADRPVGVRVRVVRAGSPRRTVRSWIVRDAQPGKRYLQRWDGLNRRGRAAPDGRYEFRVGARGRREHRGGRLRLRGHVFPVDGRHGSRGPVGEFGAPRNGGRTHAGYDILADCGTPLRAVRGGRVKRVGYDPRLYGNFLLINARKSKQQYFYSHLRSPPPLRRGERVQTAQRVGRVGQTGNARSTPCHLHFELRISGRPIDPKPQLDKWDRYS